MLRRKKLDGILSGFTKIQKQLAAYNDQVAKDLVVNESAIAELEEKGLELEACSSRASTVSTNLSKLLGDS